MFPGYVKSVDDALDYLIDLATLVGGQQVGGLEFGDLPNGGVNVKPFTIELPAGFSLTVAVRLDAGLAADFYKFNLNRGEVLVWRHDKHIGHEDAHGGPTHLHLGPRQDVRHAHTPVTLLEVIELIHITQRGEFMPPNG